jgi:hypothetical protein
MTGMGLDTERLFAECERAGRFRNQCMVSIGRDLSNAVRIGQSREAAQKCERVSGENRLACMHGVVYALVDNTWDGRYALPFCAALSEESDQNACVRASAEYLTGSFDKAPAELAIECAAHLQSPNRCADLVRR